MSKLKNYTIEGNVKEIDITERKTKKERFRAKYGFDMSNLCRDCIFVKRMKHHDKQYFKCRKLGISKSSVTDIRLSDPACSQFIKR